MLAQLLIAVLFVLSNVSYLEADERIVNGVTTTTTTIPWQAALELGKYMCGGSLIATTWILTAAHCTDGIAQASIKFGLGVNNYGTFTNYKLISQLIQHKDFNPSSMYADISLLKIPAQTLTSTIKIIPLATIAPSAGVSGIISGYGTTSSGGSISNVLREASVEIDAFSTCNSAYGNTLIASSHICAHGVTSTGLLTDTCQGDSGGPLAVGGKLAGVVSFGHGCAKAGYPGIYTNVANYVGWINTSTGTTIAVAAAPPAPAPAPPPAPAAGTVPSSYYYYYYYTSTYST